MVITSGSLDRAGAMLTTMDIGNMLAELRREHDQITEAIMSLERMAIGHQRRRGRPPAWMVAARAAAPAKRRGRPPGSKNTGKKS